MAALCLAICTAHCVENVESEVLQVVARWSVIGKVVSFLKLRLKLSSERECCNFELNSLDDWKPHRVAECCHPSNLITWTYRRWQFILMIAVTGFP